MKKLINLSLVLILIVIFYSCKKNPVGPDDSNATPGSRNYTWVADTINNPFLLFYNIWGNSPNNVWTTGSLMSDGVYHYDGQKWSLDNRVYISDPEAIWGYGNSVWIGNDKGCIWKFTDSSYVEELNDFQINGKFVDFVEMTGTSSNEIYAVGANNLNPILMKYDGSSWHLDKTLPDSAGFNQIKYCSRNDKYYIRCSLFNYTTRIYEYDRNNFRLIYSYPPSNGGPTIATIGGYPYIVAGNRIYRYFNGNMEFIFEVDDINFGGVIWGRNRDDIFIRMQDGLAHYNGTDRQYLFKSSAAIMLSPNSAVFSNVIFIPGQLRTTGYSIIYNGKLK